MDLILSYPIWYLLLCLAVGGLFAFILYFTGRRLKEVKKWLTWMMFGFRFIVITSLAFFLLSPLLKWTHETIDKPIVVLAQDNSESLLINKDSAYYKHEYLQQLNELKDKLSEDYQVEVFTYGEKVGTNLDVDYSDKQTDISQQVEELYSRYFNRNLGAIIIGGDGIYNKGSNPLVMINKIKNTSVYTIAMGDTTEKRDAVLTEVIHNKLAYLGNEFPLEIVVNATKLKGSSSRVIVKKGEQQIHSSVIDYNSDNFSVTIPVWLEAKQTGMQRYQVGVVPVEGEFTTVNNFKDIYIDVLDDKQKILILANSPHPDIRAIKESIEVNKNYEVEVSLIKDFKGKIKQYNLVVLHQLPSRSKNVSGELLEAEEEHIPVLFIVGDQTSIPGLNKLNIGLSITGIRGGKDYVSGTFNNGFAAFTLSQEARRNISDFPPVAVPFGKVKVSNSSFILFNQYIGNIAKKEPLILFNKVDRQKYGVILGDGIWRWRMFDYMQNKNHDVFNEIISKAVQYLAVKEDKSYFRVYCDNKFMENEPVIFNAEAYNESYELINEQEVSIRIYDKDGKEFERIFTPTQNAYRLEARFSPGQYRYEAKTNIDGKEYVESGEFNVNKIQVESAKVVADHHLLYRMAMENNGEMVYPDEVLSLYDKITNKEDIVSVAYQQQSLTDLINLKWIFFLLLAFISLEWFLRKWAGAY